MCTAQRRSLCTYVNSTGPPSALNAALRALACTRPRRDPMRTARTRLPCACMCSPRTARSRHAIYLVLEASLCSAASCTPHLGWRISQGMATSFALAPRRPQLGHCLILVFTDITSSTRWISTRLTVWSTGLIPRVADFVSVSIAVISILLPLLRTELALCPAHVSAALLLVILVRAGNSSSTTQMFV